MAHKKGKGSSKNGRDSGPQYLGVKVFGDQKIKNGSIIVRQRGTVFMPGKNVFISKDQTIHASMDGVVKFERVSKTKKRISVYPVVEEKETVKA